MRRILRYCAVPVLIIAGLALFVFVKKLPSEWVMSESPGEISASVQANTFNGNTAGSLKLSCEAGVIVPKVSPVIVMCEGDCDSPGGLVITLSRVYETFILPGRNANPGWAAPWEINRKEHFAKRKFLSDLADDFRAPPGDPSDFPLEREAFIQRLLAANALQFRIDDARMHFDTRKLKEALPRLQALCTTKTK